jgi:2,4-dienoyl-CoA reductase-like NADH-dependent reductase (Old Yellow Enzyme family)
MVTDLTPVQIEKLLEGFLVSADLASRAGFDVVQLNAAHGYSLSLLLSPFTNARNDYFGPSLEWFSAFLRRLRGLVDNGLLGVRISMFAGAGDRNRELEEGRSLVQLLVSADIDIVDLSAGFYTVDRHMIYPDQNGGRPQLLPVAVELARACDSVLMSFAGSITDLRRLPPDLPNNLLVSVGRALVADPSFARKSREGRFDEITVCCGAGHCHYFTKGRPNLSCKVNPKL